MPPVGGDCGVWRHAILLLRVSELQCIDRQPNAFGSCALFQSYVESDIHNSATFAPARATVHVGLAGILRSKPDTSGMDFRRRVFLYARRRCFLDCFWNLVAHLFLNVQSNSCRPICLHLATFMLIVSSALAKHRVLWTI